MLGEVYTASSEYRCCPCLEINPFLSYYVFRILLPPYPAINTCQCFACSPIHSALEIGPLRPTVSLLCFSLRHSANQRFTQSDHFFQSLSSWSDLSQYATWGRVTTQRWEAIFINKDKIQERVCLPLQYPQYHFLISFMKLFSLIQNKFLCYEKVGQNR